MCVNVCECHVYVWGVCGGVCVSVVCVCMRGVCVCVEGNCRKKLRSRLHSKKLF